jgi:hypothetical protein
MGGILGVGGSRLATTPRLRQGYGGQARGPRYIISSFQYSSEVICKQQKKPQEMNPAAFFNSEAVLP